MSFWRASDGNVRWLLIFGILQVLSTTLDIRRFGVRDLHWVESAGFAVACFAFLPLEEPSRKGWPYQRKLRTPYGVLAVALLSVSVALFFWRVIHDLGIV